MGVLCDPRRRAPWGRPRRGGADRKLPGKPRAWPGEERGHGTPAREGQTVRSAFAGFPGQRGEGRSAANFGVEFTVVGALRVERGDVGECLGLGARGRGWVCGFQSVAGAWCVVSSWVRTPWVQVSGLWVLTPTGTSIPLEKAVVANLSLAGYLSLLVSTPLFLRDVSPVNLPPVASLLFWGLERASPATSTRTGRTCCSR